MSLSISELAKTRETVEKLLEQLKLETYVFDLEPQEGQWILKVECATDEGWEAVTLKANKEYFQHGADDAVIHQVLLDEWREALSGCKVKLS